MNIRRYNFPFLVEKAPVIDIKRTAVDDIDRFKSIKRRRRIECIFFMSVKIA
jgi:hypothetical protein